MSNTLDEVDAIMAELGLNDSKPHAVSKSPASKPSTTTELKPKNASSISVSEDEVDRLMAEINVSPPSQLSTSPPPSRGPGRGRGVSSGPGAAWRGRGRGSSGPGASRPPPATETPDGRPITHTGPPCAHCGEMIIGQCLNAIGKTYHPDHFVCTHCNKPFPNGAFIEHEDQPYCESDYNELFCPRCATCQQPITDKCVNAFGNKYHPNHFTCTGCGLNLVGKSYKEDDGDLYCTACKKSREKVVVSSGEICAKCKKPIVGEYIVVNGQKVHPEHFRCEECGKDFKNGNCHEYESLLYCQECYNRLLRNTCASCNKPIQGRSVTALGRVWHPDHFVCCVCHEPFSGSNFYEHDRKPYCETHYTQQFGEPCAKCGRPVVNNACQFLDKIYHVEHFTCTSCDKPLKKGKITEWDSKPMCIECYMKLPTEVRKRVEKKRAAEKKAEKEKLKEEKKNAKGKT